jgi:hypothetical protein
VLKEVVEQDKVYQRPKEVVKAGRKPKNRETLGPTKTFDGICLYLPELFEKDVWTWDCVHLQDNSPVKLTFIRKHRKKLSDRSHVQFCNT